MYLATPPVSAQRARMSSPVARGLAARRADLTVDVGKGRSSRKEVCRPKSGSFLSRNRRSIREWTEPHTVRSICASSWRRSQMRRSFRNPLFGTVQFRTGQFDNQCSGIANEKQELSIEPDVARAPPPLSQGRGERSLAPCGTLSTNAKCPSLSTNTNQKLSYTSRPAICICVFICERST